MFRTGDISKKVDFELLRALARLMRSSSSTLDRQIADAIQHRPGILTSNAAYSWDEINSFLEWFDKIVTRPFAKNVVEAVYKQIFCNIQSSNTLHDNESKLFARIIQIGGAPILIHSLNQFESNQSQLYIFVQNRHLARFPKLIPSVFRTKIDLELLRVVVRCARRARDFDRVILDVMQHRPEIITSNAARHWNDVCDVLYWLMNQTELAPLRKYSS